MECLVGAFKRPGRYTEIFSIEKVIKNFRKFRDFEFLTLFSQFGSNKFTTPLGSLNYSIGQQTSFLVNRKVVHEQLI